MPVPAGSRIEPGGFALGLGRAGVGGALAAWVAFTLPSALLLLAFAHGADAFAGPIGGAVIHGLKLVAAAIVAHAVWGMARALAPDRPRGAAQAAMRGVNAAVVGILAAALYDPVWTDAVLTAYDFAVAAAGFVLLALWRLPPWSVVIAVTAATVLPALAIN